jgi:hypothetical protein
VFEKINPNHEAREDQKVNAKKYEKDSRLFSELPGLRGFFLLSSPELHRNSIAKPVIISSSRWRYAEAERRRALHERDPEKRVPKARTYGFRSYQF